MRQNILKIVITLFLISILFLCGCITEENNANQNTTNENNEISNGASEQNGEENDPCGNDIGNGDEIVFGQITLTESNPDNPFRSLTIHPTDPNTILIGTEANGFVKSTDGGQTWVRLRYGLRHMEMSYSEQYYPEVYDIAFSESNPDIIYAATPAGEGPIKGSYPSSIGGVHKSIDGGETWMRKNCGLENGCVCCVYVSPDNPDIAVIGVRGGEPTFSGLSGYYDGGIFRTTDGGESWSEVDLETNAVKDKFTHIIYPRDDPSTLFTFGLNWDDTSQNSGFFKSTDVGETWTPFAEELKYNLIRYFDVSSDGTIIYAVGEMEIFKSTDSGTTWSKYDLQTSGYAVEIFPDDADRVLFSRVGGVYLTEDGLQTETKVIDVEGRHPADIAIAPSDSNIVYAIDVGYDVYKSVDAGVTFIKLVNLRDDVFSAIP